MRALNARKDRGQKANPVRLAHRVDALVVAYRVPLDSRPFAALSAAHRGAVALGVSQTEHEVGGVSFALSRMLARGVYRLSNADADVLVGCDEYGWTVETTARAMSLATTGWQPL